MRAMRVPAVALVGLALAAAGCKSPASSSSKKPKGTGVALASTAARNLTLSPDGAVLAFLGEVAPPPEKSAPEGVFQGVLTTVEARVGATPRPLGGGVTTLDDAYRFSPDGKSIAWLQGFRFRDQAGELQVAPVPAGDARSIAQDATYYRFSPDGKWLGYVAAGGMHLFDLAAGADKKLAEPAATFSFSKDSKAVVVRRPSSAGGELLLFDVGAAADAQPRKLGQNVGEYDFSPDGARVVFTSRVGDPAAPYTLFAWSAEGGLVKLGEDVTTFLFSPDAAWVSFVQKVGMRPFGNLQLVPASGGPPRKIGEGVDDQTWAPDSKSLAIRESHEDKSGRAWATFKLVTIPSGAVRLEEKGGQRDFINSLFSSDGTHAAYLRKQGDQVKLNLIEVAGDKPAREVARWVFNYQFAPGDREIWYRTNCTRNGRECELMALNVSDPSQPARQVVAGVLQFRFSPDGQRVLLSYPRFDTEFAGDLGWAAAEAGKQQTTKGIDYYALPGALFLDKEGSRVAYIVNERKREGVYVAELKPDAAAPAAPAAPAAQPAQGAPAAK